MNQHVHEMKNIKTRNTTNQRLLCLWDEDVNDLCRHGLRPSLNLDLLGMLDKLHFAQV